MSTVHALWLPLVLLSACATSEYRIVESGTGEAIGLSELARELATKDVVFLAEEHDNGAAHRTHLDLVRHLHVLRPHLVISLEMFERDVQDELMMYLLGITEETEFLRKTRPWPNYQTDYRPFVEYARAEGLLVLAANVPRPLAAQVAEQGLEAVAGHRHAAREVHAPKDEYWEAFGDAMGGHGGVGDEDSLLRYYQAQCLKDDTMAETIVDHLADARSRGRDPLIVHVNGRMHSDRGLGTAARVKLRDPELQIALVGMEAVDDVTAAAVASPEIGDYVLLVAAEPAPQLPAGEPAPVLAAEPRADSAAEPVSAAGDEPALGLVPDYEYGGSGLLVADVPPGGPASAGGILPGDVVVEVNGVAVDDIYSYMDAMATVTVGARVTVVVRRGEEALDVAVTAGRR